jgi:hypothetical protein
MVTTPGGASAASSGGEFTFIPAPEVTSVDPDAGPETGGTSVTIGGRSFTGATAVRFGSAEASDVAVVSESEITATSPAGSGTVYVRVTTPGGTSADLADAKFTYDPVPVVSSLESGGGPEAGGAYVDIGGTGFTGATAVRFGSAEATGLTVNSDTQITVISPAGSGTVYVTVTTPGGTSDDTDDSEYEYFPAPEVSGIDPDSGPESGGTTVTITGSNFSPPNDVIVYFRTSNAETQAEHTVESETEIIATSPAASVSGAATVIVSTLGGNASTGFTYTDDSPYEDEPHEDEPYEDEPYEDEPHEDEPYEDEPYDDSGD